MSDTFANTPVLLWQMGKVGSTSIYKALQDVGLSPVQLHVLEQDRIDTVTKEYQDAGFDVPSHIEDARRIRNLIANSDQRIRIVSLVRDPVARNLSALFETWDVYPPEFSNGDDLEKLAEWFVMNFDYSVLKWFDNEIKAVTGLDVYKQQFDQSNKHLLLETDRIKILVLRSEDPQASKEQSLMEFLELPELSLGYINTSESKPRAELWKDMKKSTKVSSNLADIVYQSNLVRHFYEVDEIRNFRSFWGQPAADVRAC